MSFADKFKQQEEEARKEGFKSGGGWFKFVEGGNLFRVISEPEMIFEKHNTGICYTDCGYEGSPKLMCYVLDRKDGKVKIAKLPYTVGTTIVSFESNEDYAFEGFPMPYDIRVNAVGAGTKEVEYTVVPRPVREPVENKVLDELNAKKPMLEVITKMKEAKKAEHMADGSFQAEQERRAKLKDELSEKRGTPDSVAYPTDDISPEDIPF